MTRTTGRKRLHRPRQVADLEDYDFLEVPPTELPKLTAVGHIPGFTHGVTYLGELVALGCGEAVGRELLTLLARTAIDDARARAVLGQAAREAGRVERDFPRLRARA